MALSCPWHCTPSPEEQRRHLQRVGNAREPGLAIHHMETAEEKQASLVSSPALLCIVSAKELSWVWNRTCNLSS